MAVISEKSNKLLLFCMLWGLLEPRRKRGFLIEEMLVAWPVQDGNRAFDDFCRAGVRHPRALPSQAMPMAGDVNFAIA
ncbi:hypothetical protein EDB83DRAFT_2418072 [Lactarius deliciosus]|nr:hypothetical protein EDB83DRAFT_2418072 [Lactarius deliciosus]